MNEISEGKFEVAGTVSEIHPLWALLAKWWAKDPLITIFSLDIPPRTDKKMAQMVRAITELKQVYQEKTSLKNPFIVVLMPNDRKDQKIIKYLDKANLPFIDYSGLDMSRKLKGPRHLPGDQHPSPEYHEIFSQILRRDIAEFIY